MSAEQWAWLTVVSVAVWPRCAKVKPRWRHWLLRVAAMSRDFAYWHREAVERGKPDPVRWAQLKVNQQQSRWHVNDAVVHRSRTDKPEPPPSQDTFARAWEKEQARRADDAAATLHLPGLDPLPELKPTEYMNAWRYEQRQQTLRQQRRRAPRIVATVSLLVLVVALILNLI